MPREFRRVPQGLRNMDVEVVGIRVIGDKERAEKIRIGAGYIGVTGSVIAVGTNDGGSQSTGNVLVRFDAEFYDRLCETFDRILVSQPCNHCKYSCRVFSRPLDLDHWVTSGSFEVLTEESFEISAPEVVLVEPPQVVKEEIVHETSQLQLW